MNQVRKPPSLHHVFLNSTIDTNQNIFVVVAVSFPILSLAFPISLIHFDIQGTLLSDKEAGGAYFLGVNRTAAGTE